MVGPSYSEGVLFQFSVCLKRDGVVSSMAAGATLKAAACGIPLEKRLWSCTATAFKTIGCKQHNQVRTTDTLPSAMPPNIIKRSMGVLYFLRWLLACVDIVRTIEGIGLALANMDSTSSAAVPVGLLPFWGATATRSAQRATKTELI
jgi:hypothetical protein